MNRKPSPMAVWLGVNRTMDGAVEGAVFLAVNGAVSGAAYETVDEIVCMGVHRAVDGAVTDALRRAVRGGRPRPNFRLFLADIRQARGDST